MFCADSWTGGTDLTGRPLELGVSALAGATLTGAPAITDLLVRGQAGCGVQRTVTGTACPVGITYTHPTLTVTMSCHNTTHRVRDDPLKFKHHLIL